MIQKTTHTVSSNLLSRAINSLLDVDFKLSLNEPTGDFFYDEWKIKDKFKNTVWEDILNSLPEKQGEARIINLDIKTCYTMHSDIDDRWHLALSEGESYLVDLDNKQMHQVDLGIWYTMNAGILHSAVNFSDKERYQLVVRKLLNNSILVDPVNVSLSLENPPSNYRYVIDQVISPKLNYWNKHKQLCNFKQTTNNSLSFMLEKDALLELENAVSNINFKVNLSYDSI
jgi:hypothetical protein